MFIDLLNEGGVDVNKEYPEEGNNTLLLLAVQRGSLEFAKELLSLASCDPNTTNRRSRVAALHLAVTQGNPDMVRLLLRSGASVNIKKEDGTTPLHIATLRSSANWVSGNDKYVMIQRMKEIVTLLLETENINVDIENNLGISPLSCAVDKGTEEVVRMLLKRGACVTSEFEDEDDDDIRTIEDKLRQRFPKLKNEVTDKNRKNNNSTEAELFKLLFTEFSHPGGFRKKFDSVKKSVDLDFDNGNNTMLQYCAYNGYHDLVDILLSAGADPNKMSAHNKVPAVVWAAHHGYHEVIRVFKRKFIENNVEVDFARVDEKSERYENVLHKVLKQESRTIVNKNLRNYDKCLKLLLDDGNLRFKNNMAAAINGQDNLGNTPLHVAAQTGNHEAVRRLLRCEANLGLKNARELTPIVHIAPDIMEEFLDDCLESDGSTTGKDFQITFKYSFLGPPRMRKFALGKEGEPLLDTKEVMEDGVTNTKQLPETEPLWYMSQIKEHRHLLSHPTITSFLWMKWRKMRPYFYINVGFYLLFFSFLTAWILMKTEYEEWSGPADPFDPPTREKIMALQWITFVLLILFTIREFVQLTVSYRRYFFNLENLLELSLIIMTYCLMFVSLSLSEFKNISALVLLLSWLEVVLLIGGHPRLSTYVSMFTKISFNFAKFLCLFISLIIGFGLCFFILYRNPKEELNDGKVFNEYFSSPSKALLKTIIISLTGEIEFEDLVFGGTLGWMTFLLFVFLIMLVLVNLLNGLAVSDIALIQKEAEIMSHISRVELMCQIESILLGDPFSFLENFPRLPKVARKLPTYNLLSKLTFLNRIFSIFGTNNFLLFSKRLWRKEAVFHPNRSKKEKGEGAGQLGCLNCGDLKLPESILEEAKSLVIRRNTVTEEMETQQRLRDMERALKLLADQQNHVISLINVMKPN